MSFGRSAISIAAQPDPQAAAAAALIAAIEIVERSATKADRRSPARGLWTITTSSPGGISATSKATER